MSMSVPQRTERRVESSAILPDGFEGPGRLLRWGREEAWLSWEMLDITAKLIRELREFRDLEEIEGRFTRKILLMIEVRM